MTLEQALVSIGQMTEQDKETILKTLLSTQSKVEKLRALLALGEDKDYYLTYILGAIEARILNYINLPCLPEELEPILLAMGAQYYNTSGLGADASEEAEVTSVKRGDVQVNYATSTASKSTIFNLGGGDADFFGWRSVLNEYRRLKW